MIEILLVVFVCLILVGVNGLCVAAEFGIASSSRTVIESKKDAGGRRARLISHILSDPRRLDRYIATAQVGITIASIGLGMYGEHQLAEIFEPLFENLGANAWIGAHTAASIIALLILTVLHVTIGEMIPKALALQYPERVTGWLVIPMLTLKYALFPLVVSLNTLGILTLRLFGIRREFGEEHFRSPEDIAIIIEESRGKLGGESSRILKDLLEFGDLTAGEVMVPRVNVIGVPIGMTSEKCQELFRNSCHTRYPVYEGSIDRIIGMVHLKELARLSRQNKRLEKESVRPVPFLPETASLDKVLATMHRGEGQMVAILDEHGGTAGIVTYEDLFEEVIGEIDEGTERLSIQKDDDGVIHALGSARVEEIGEALEIPLTSETVDTVNGLILTSLDRPPVVGDTITYEGVRFEVVAVERRRVTRCRVTMVEKPGEEQK